MPKPRFSGGSTSIRLSSSQMPPPVSGCNPAMQFSAVDLPQPDGPSSAMNSPRWIFRSSPFNAASCCPSALVKLRETESRRNCSKVCFMTISCAFLYKRRRALAGASPSHHSVTPTYLVFAAPISRSHFWKAATIDCALSGSTCGRSASSFAYSGRPNF